MKIKKIEWISKEAKEAEVAISDGSYECVCFYHPCTISLGEIILDPIIAFDIENIIKVNNGTEVAIKKIIGSMGYKVIARLENINPNIVALGKIMIDIGNNVPKDLYVGDLLSFKCSRLDV